jgi:hypothetical protein
MASGVATLADGVGRMSSTKNFTATASREILCSNYSYTDGWLQRSTYPHGTTTDSLLLKVRADIRAHLSRG